MTPRELLKKYRRIEDWDCKKGQIRKGWENRYLDDDCIICYGLYKEVLNYSKIQKTKFFKEFKAHLKNYTLHIVLIVKGKTKFLGFEFIDSRYIITKNQVKMELNEAFERFKKCSVQRIINKEDFDKINLIITESKI